MRKPHVEVRENGADRTVAGSVLTQLRRRTGMSQTELAGKAGTSRTAISAIEHGRVDVTTERLGRIVRAADFDLDIRVVPSHKRPHDPTARMRTKRDRDDVSRADPVADLARNVETEINRPWAGWGHGRAPHLMALRFVVRFVNACLAAGPAKTESLVAAAPPSTGEARYDALIAAAVEYVCGRLGVIAPAWTSEPPRSIDAFWEPDEPDITEPRGYRIAHGLSVFKRHGVLLAENDLVAV